MDDLKYKALKIIYERKYLSWRQAVEIVGGKKRLQHLIDEQAVRVSSKPNNTTSKWRLNAADCIENVKPTLVKKLANTLI